MQRPRRRCICIRHKEGNVGGQDAGPHMLIIFVDDWAVGLAGVYYSYVDEEPDLLRIMEHSRKHKNMKTLVVRK